MKPCRRCGGPNDRRPQRLCSDCLQQEEHGRRQARLAASAEYHRILDEIRAKHNAPREAE